MEAPPTCQPTTLPLLFKRSLPLCKVNQGHVARQDETEKEKERDRDDKGNTNINKRKRTTEEQERDRDGTKKIIRMEHESPSYPAVPRLRVDVIRVFHTHHWYEGPPNQVNLT